MDPIDRRTFLSAVSGQLWTQAQTLWGTWRAGATTSGTAAGQRVAIIDLARCVAWDGGMCQACYLQCPLRERAMRCDEGKPVVVASGCDGCGVCVAACRNVNDLGAIRLLGE
jgi:Pyruvate/2-oxoacid:ferredoxin oxidoreductase delta subunit